MTEKLNSFDFAARKDALTQLAAQQDKVVPTDNINMHFHSFYSYNAESLSPTAIAYRSYKEGLYAAGLCDFDVLDGLEEFLVASEMLGIRATVNLETRAFLSEYADRDINSPGEPGVTYIMGAGFAKVPAENTPQWQTLGFYRQKAADRNTDLIGRINAKLPDIAIDYAADVLPLTPAGGATERHIISAYLNKSLQVFADQADLVKFWSGIFSTDADKTVALIGDRAKMEDSVRSKLAKRGGFGYVQPSEDTFPPVEDFIDWVLACEAVPLVTWLDGSSAGEADAEAMLECLAAKGAGGLNIIPDRNWNYADAEIAVVKMDHLKRMVTAADAMNLPINIGTEMNKPGLPFVDDLDCAALAPFKQTFIKGAQVFVGHSILSRYADFSYVSKSAHAEFGADTKQKNDFFASVGALPPLTTAIADKYSETSPLAAYVKICDSVKASRWIV